MCDEKRIPIKNQDLPIDLIITDGSFNLYKRFREVEGSNSTVNHPDLLKSPRIMLNLFTLFSFNTDSASSKLNLFFPKLFQSLEYLSNNHFCTAFLALLAITITYFLLDNQVKIETFIKLVIFLLDSQAKYNILTRRFNMKTEDVNLDIKRVFDRKKAKYTPYDIARMRYLCRIFVEFVLEMENEKK